MMQRREAMSRIGAAVGGAMLTAALGGEQAMAAAVAADEQYLVYIGSYTTGDSKGIHCFSMHRESGKLDLLGATGGVRNPSFLAIHPSGKHLYSVAEIADFGGGRGGAVAAFSLDANSGALEFLNTQSSGGPGPCHLTVDRTGRYVLAANYGGGSVSSTAIAADGRLQRTASFHQHTGSSVDRRRQEGPHAHSINLDPSNRFAYAADLGLDRILIYRFNETTGELTAAEPPFGAVAPGSGPRHFATHPRQATAYVINEMASTVTAFRRDAETGALEQLQTITTLPAGFSGGTSTAEVQVHPSGRFLFGSNRGHDSIAIFTIDGESGKLAPLGFQPTGGKTPRNFGVTPCGKFLVAANQGSDNLVVFRIDEQTGQLQQTGHGASVSKPVCVKFLPRQG